MNRKSPSNKRTHLTLKKTQEMPQSQNADQPISLPFLQYRAIVLWYPHNYSSGHVLTSSAPRIYHNPQRKSEIYIEAVTCDFQQCGILTSVHSEQPVQPPFRLRFSQ